MKLTKSRVKEIINEEVESFFEGSAPCPSPLACPGETEEAEAMTQMAQGMSTLQEDDAFTDQMADCLDRIVNPKNEDDIFATLSARTVEELETIYDMIMRGRIQLEEDEQETAKLPRVSPKDIDRLRRTHTADYKRHQAARKNMKK
tara:strand:+ start:102 stop:539 length:438 start_codon:yes stop_codon:yes gene_type:complete